MSFSLRRTSPIISSHKRQDCDSMEPKKNNKTTVREVKNTSKIKPTCFIDGAESDDTVIDGLTVCTSLLTRTDCVGNIMDL